METQDQDGRIPIIEWPMCSHPSDTDDGLGSAMTSTGLAKKDSSTCISSAHHQSNSDNVSLNKRCAHLPVNPALQPPHKKRQEMESQRHLLNQKESNEQTAGLREPLAPVRVAKWWRNKQQYSSSLNVTSKNVNTRLYHISRTEECQEFLKDEKKSLKERLSYCLVKDKAAVHAALASIDDWLNLPESALKSIALALDQSNSNPELVWLKEKLCKQCKVLRTQKEMIEHCRNNQNTFPATTKVERISSKNLSIQDFKDSYVKRGKPVILEDVVSSMVEKSWDLDYIKSKAGLCNAPVKRHVVGSVEWAKLEEERVVTVAEHINNVKQGSTEDYLFDWSLPLHCPQLADEITIPKYFTDNFLTQTTPGSMYHDSWPSLFVAPSGVASDLHVDAFASSFWMALFQGEKRWTFFDPEDMPLLYPKYVQSLDPVFDVNIGKPDLKSFPLLALTKPKQCVLRAGDLLFVPAGSPHLVENLTPSVAVSSNYVDATNYSQVCKELQISALLNPRARQLLEELESPEFKAKAMFDEKVKTNS
ncbi:bifunctional arginine demethylase and lysyl-hydroxylase jmjd6-b [Plakobranchus ocellatus]|uniref:Bifunctional arginine demethylase and lysyl-hydroxylase jmjd6-b n=1 Tax=Plakobranchus ocellatus TaxID=259542 RepID=A0AAV3Z8P2_9GAST|nr:bifunctional arginine demethylase and lysyl-hydroxylase jmjd6-b [Plakobranchus ocellatus]